MLGEIALPLSPSRLRTLRSLIILAISTEQAGDAPQIGKPMKQLYKVQSHSEKGWRDITDWITSLSDAKKIASTTAKPNKDHVRVIKKTINNPNSSTITLAYVL